MKTKLLLICIAVGSLLVSCEPKNEIQELKDQLDAKKLEYSNIKLEINDLQKRLQDLDTNKVVSGIAVNIQKIEKVYFEHFFLVNGSFEPVEYAYISPETSGQIKEILVKEGDRVNKGQILVKLNNSMIESNIQAAKTALDLSTIVYNKQKELWDKNIGSEMDFLRAKADMERLQDQLKSLQSQKDLSIIKSPIDGIVDNSPSKIGELAMPGQLLMQIVNLSEFNLNTEVSESYLPYLKKGDMVKINLLAYENETLNAEINNISNIINPENRSFKVKMKVPNKNGLIKPNMLAQAQFKDFESRDAIIVPSIIIKNDFNGSYLFIVEKNGSEQKAKKVYVETGRSRDGQTMITKGLQVDDLVIVNGYNQVVEGSLVSIK